MSFDAEKDALSASTQTDWSWLQDLCAVGRDTVPTPRTLMGEETDLKKSAATEDEGKTKNKKNIKRIEDNSVEANETIMGPDIPMEENVSGELFDRDSNENESENENSPEHHVIVEPVDDMSFDESDLDTSSQGTFYDEETLFPSVGPPQMLEFLRESHSHVVLNSLEKTDNSSFDAERGYQKSFFSGPCQFCGKNILPLPTVQEMEFYPSSELFCCDQYAEFVKRYLTYSDNKKNEQEVIDIKPHAPYGSKAARRLAKERAAERMREKEIEKHKAVTAQANFFNFTRQVKTIQYALSSPKCMQDGWTIRPTTPHIEAIKLEDDEFSIDFNTSLLQKKDELYEKFYEDGSPFLLIFPDGTGSCYYPSGNVAVIITSFEKEKYQYILQKDTDDYDTDDPGILGVFEPNGKASCYFKDGSLRLVLTQNSGVQLDKQGNYKKRWHWHFIKGHVHTPPFQPICFALNKQLSCRVMEQDHIVITFASGQRAVRFNVGAKLKVVKPTMPPITKKDEHERFMELIKNRFQSCQEKIQLMMRFPKSPKLDVLISKAPKDTRTKSSDNTKLQLPKLKGKEPSVIVN